MRKVNIWVIISIVAEFVKLISDGMNQKQATACTAAKFNIRITDVWNIINNHFEQK